MNIGLERAREACESCRKSHKKCTYDDSSTRCARCEKRNTACSLFLSETTAAAQQGLPAVITVGSPPESRDGLGTPHISAGSSNFSYQLPSQEGYYWTTTAFMGNTQGEYPVETMFRDSVDQQEQPAMDRDGLYGNNNVFGGHINP